MRWQLVEVGGVRPQIRSAGRVPEDVSIIGSDDSLLAEHIDPPLTTIRQPASALADAACRELLNQMSGKPAYAGEQFYQPELIVRGSSGSARRPA